MGTKKYANVVNEHGAQATAKIDEKYDGTGATAFREQWYVNHCVPGENFAMASFRGYGKLAPAPSEAAANCLGRLKISTSERRMRRQSRRRQIRRR